MQGGSSFIWLIGFFALMYFLMIRPQQKQKKKRQEILDSVEKGEKVVTIGGIHGTITSLSPETMILEIAPNVEITMQRSSIAFVVSEDEEADEDIDEDIDEDTETEVEKEDGK